MVDEFKNLLSSQLMTDVTLACDGMSIKAHKIVLSACSPLFHSLLLENPCKHPIIILQDMKFNDLKNIIEFMYHGEVNISQDQLATLLNNGAKLMVKGLAEMASEKTFSDKLSEETDPKSVQTTLPSSKSIKNGAQKQSTSDNETKSVSSNVAEFSNDVTMDINVNFSNSDPDIPEQSLQIQSANFQNFTSAESENCHIDYESDNEIVTSDSPKKTNDLSSEENVQIQDENNTKHSSNLVTTAISSESSTKLPESPLNIEFDSFELNPSMSPLPGPSDGTDDSMIVDQSSVSSHVDASYENVVAHVSHDPQPGGSNSVIRTIYFTKNDTESSKHDEEASNSKKKWNYRCCTCNLLVASKGHLNIHMRTHTGERPFTCHLCGKTTIRQHDLQLHMRTHTGIKPYACPICGMKFNNSSNYRRHYKRLHPTAERVVQVCKICQEQFDSKELLNGHLFNQHSIQNSHVCVICQKSYKRHYDLKTHLRVHSKEKPYSCKQCFKRFSYRSNQLRHIRIHHNKKSRTNFSPEKKKIDDPDYTPESGNL
ncbi:protein bric-a-brac 1 [Caerostris extrusa]|uniref:Protein bric-a-brac 1 n=1 Tax=Caerostris extrusa TaxID=172846 RepID=A0AAV4MVW5_CAEEX|nr:protein bric-a-brac 1 [Caerostris extrusa]